MVKSESSKGGRVASKGALGILLSKLEGFESPKVQDEQYSTDPEIGAEVLWQIAMRENLSKVSADMGCGTGLLGIGLLALGAKKVHFVEKDEAALETTQRNLEKIKNELDLAGEGVLHSMDISAFKEPVELIVQNPPFGVKVRGADRPFLEKAMELGQVIYSFHKSESKVFIGKLAAQKGFGVTHTWDFEWPLKATYSFHSKKREYIKVSCFRLERSERAQ